MVYSQADLVCKLFIHVVYYKLKIVFSAKHNNAAAMTFLCGHLEQEIK